MAILSSGDNNRDLIKIEMLGVYLDVFPYCLLLHDLFLIILLDADLFYCYTICLVMKEDSSTQYTWIICHLIVISQETRIAVHT